MSPSSSSPSSSGSSNVIRCILCLLISSTILHPPSVVNSFSPASPSTKSRSLQRAAWHRPDGSSIQTGISLMHTTDRIAASSSVSKIRLFASSNNSQPGEDKTNTKKKRTNKSSSSGSGSNDVNGNNGILSTRTTTTTATATKSTTNATTKSAAVASATTKTKKTHDRTIDRRKSPALWRYDLSGTTQEQTTTQSTTTATSTPKSQDEQSGIHHHQQQHQQQNQKPHKTKKQLTQPPELMSPAGGYPQLHAAIVNGADAVYVGMTSYSARARASNFDPDPSLLFDPEGNIIDISKISKNYPQDSNTNTNIYEEEEEEEYNKEGRITTAANGNNHGNSAKKNKKEKPASLAQAIHYAHKHNVRVYVAFNTLVFDEELHEVQGLLEQCWECGVDAVIVQDVGVALIAKEVVERMGRKKMSSGGGDGKIIMGKGLGGAPMEIHASTQQTVTCSDGVDFSAERTNATRVVLGRELSLSEITQISTNTDTEIEAFVHGALCVSYSGQCFSSEAWGGRSANRGQCAQACRLPYGLIANGELRHLSFDGIEGIMGRGSSSSSSSGSSGGDGSNTNEEIQYLLSPQDLCGLDQVEGLTRAGVACLKIEGRLKDSSYVAATTRAYRKAIDAAWLKVLQEQQTTADNSTLINLPSSYSQRVLSSPEENVSRSDLTHVFARGQDETHDGLTPGFFEGPKHQELVIGRSPRHRGVHVGRVVSANSGALVVKLDDKWLNTLEHSNHGSLEDAGFPLKRGDGIVVDRSMPQDEELGGPIYDLQTNREGLVKIRFGKNVERRWRENDARAMHGRSGYRSSPPVFMAPKGSHVWKTADAEVGKRMRRLAELDAPRSAARVSVEGRVGEPLTVRIVDVRSGKVGEASSSEVGVLKAVDGKGLDAKSISKAIGKLGNSRWTVSPDCIDVSLMEKGFWCPLSWVKETRRRALENLESSIGEATVVDCDSDEGKTAASTFDDELAIVDQMLEEMSQDSAENASSNAAGSRVSVLARSYDQVDALCTMIEKMGSTGESSVEMSLLNEIIVDFLEIDGIKAAVNRIRKVKSRLSHNVKVVVASPRIIKPGEEGIWRTLLKTEPDGILIRSTGLLHRLVKLGGAGKKITIHSAEADGTMEVTIPELIGDFSLNAANAITAYELLKSGLQRVTASYDLSADAITELATLLGKKASHLEVVVHQHMPIFHTEHCVFARFLSKGNSYQDCGHVCTRNTVHLRDQNGKDNLVLADMGCRNTVFMSESQSGVYNMHEWSKAGVGQLRIELVDENGKDSVDIAMSYLRFMSGEDYANDVWSVLEGVRDSNGRIGGVGVGSLRNTAERRSGEISPSYNK